MTDVTAKVQLNNKAESADKQFTSLSFSANYADDKGNPINTEWSFATPHCGINMTVNAATAKHFEEGKAYTITFKAG